MNPEQIPTSFTSRFTRCVVISRFCILSTVQRKESVNIEARFRGVVQVFNAVIKLTLILIEQAVIPYYPVINVRRDLGLPCMVNVSIGDR